MRNLTGQAIETTVIEIGGDSQPSSEQPKNDSIIKCNFYKSLTIPSQSLAYLSHEHINKVFEWRAIKQRLCAKCEARRNCSSIEHTRLVIASHNHSKDTVTQRKLYSRLAFPSWWHDGGRSYLCYPVSIGNGVSSHRRFFLSISFYFYLYLPSIHRVIVFFVCHFIASVSIYWMVFLCISRSPNA